MDGDLDNKGGQGTRDGRRVQLECANTKLLTGFKGVRRTIRWKQTEGSRGDIWTSGHAGQMAASRLGSRLGIAGSWHGIVMRSHFVERQKSSV